MVGIPAVGRILFGGKNSEHRISIRVLAARGKRRELEMVANRHSALHLYAMLEKAAAEENGLWNL